VLIVHHGVIYTVDSAVAEAMAVEDGKILATGTNAQILEQYDAATSIDLEGKTVFPGFIDAHCHFTGYATDSWKADLTGTHSFEEIIEKIKVYSQSAPMEWIYGRGWDQNDWAIKEYP
jgi:predicted amidohydrolase YtcJ